MHSEEGLTPKNKRKLHLELLRQDVSQVSSIKKNAGCLSGSSPNQSTLQAKILSISLLHLEGLIFPYIFPTAENGIPVGALPVTSFMNPLQQKRRSDVASALESHDSQGF